MLQKKFKKKCKLICNVGLHLIAMLINFHGISITRPHCCPRVYREWRCSPKSEKNALNPCFLENGCLRHQGDARKKTASYSPLWQTERSRCSEGCVRVCVALCVFMFAGAFLIPFTIMLVIAGLPLMFMELSFGQYANLGPVAIYKKFCPLFRGLGYGMVIVSAIVMLYYNLIIAWTLFYMFASFNSVLPWQNCEEWSTERK